MRLRQKKTHNLSEDALYSDFQNFHFQTHIRKPDFVKTPLKDPCKASITKTLDKSSYAEILVRFIANINLAKHSQQIKTKSRPASRNFLGEQNFKPKRLRKTSENISFDEEKKVEQIKPAFTESQAPNRKSKTEEKGPETSSTFSINKIHPGFNVSQNKRKEASEQNIINNCFMEASFNMNDYARLVESPYFMLNQQIMSNWLQINPFMAPNIPQLSSLAQGMKNGLSRQLEIYERFRPQPNPSLIEETPLQFSSQYEHTEEKVEKKVLEMEPPKKISPDKIFKRASYHVGIAYSIYMDGIQKQGKRIKNFSDIDPTRFAKKYKISGQKSS